MDRARVDVFTQEIDVNEAEMHDFCRVLAQNLTGNETVLLIGTLGMGKTSFTREIIHSLCGETTEVTSPTFTLMQEYTAKQGFTIQHYDLYRIEHTEELMELGLQETLGRVLTLVEWPEVAEGYFPLERMEIRFSQGKNADSRRLQVSASGGMVAAVKTAFQETGNGAT